MDFGRVNGNLALSRAIGDFEFKKSAELSPEQQIVTAFPDVIAHTINDDDEFLVIACDGAYFVITFRSIILIQVTRHMGLSVLSSCHRICQTWNRCEARALEDIRKHDGQLFSFK